MIGQVVIDSGGHDISRVDVQWFRRQVTVSMEDIKEHFFSCFEIICSDMSCPEMRCSGMRCSERSCSEKFRSEMICSETRCSER